MSTDKFKAQARAILEGCPFNMEDAIAEDLREADAENQRLREELVWALEILEQQAGSDELRKMVKEKRRSLALKNKD